MSIRVLLVASVLLFILLVRLWNLCPYGAIRCYYKYKFRRNEDIGVSITLIPSIRSHISKCFSAQIISPQRELLLGMVLGLDEFKNVPAFKKALKETGTVHAVVVSGYNMNLVFGLLLGVVGAVYSIANVMLVVIIGLFYSLLAGFEPPVVRALLTSSLILLARYHGRNVSYYWVIGLSGWLILIIYPWMLFNLSFLLSFGASLSIVAFSPLIQFLLSSVTQSIRVVSNSTISDLGLNTQSSYNNNKGCFLYSDFVTTLSAQILVWPLLSIYFGVFNLAGFVVNPLVLWIVPLITMGGGVLAIFCYLPVFLEPLIKFMSIILSVPLNFFVYSVNFFSSFSFINQKVKLDITTSICYYALVFIIWFLSKKFIKK